MIAAIYARKSTEQTGVNDEEKSVTRQIEHGKAYALTKGWTVSEDHVYVDDGISGAEFVNRPGFIRLMNALKPRPAFQFLVMSEESRLGREQIETAYALQSIMDAGVRVFFYLEDRERTLDSALDKMMLSLTGFASEMEREKASQRTHDAMLRKARSGFVTGGKTYGYDNIDVHGDARGIDGERQRLHVVRRINQGEALVVRRLFERYASGGYGLRALTKELNAEGILPPTKHRKGWAPSCIREILHRELYQGVVIWNKTQAIHRGGTQKSRKRPETEWVRIDAPDLRIVSEDVWQAVAARLQHTRTEYARTADGRLFGHPSGADLRSAYLLSGIAQCAVCGGSIVCQKRGRNNGRNFYMCVYHHNRGPEVCGNDLRITQGVLDSAVLHALISALDERVLAEAVQRALTEIRAGHTKFPDERLAIERHLSLVEARLRHLVEAVATGRSTDAIFDELGKEEAAKKTLAAQLASLTQRASLTSLDGKRIERALVERVADVKGLLGRHVPQTRQMLRKLISGRIQCAPFNDTRGRGYNLAATGTYAGLLSEKMLVKDGGGGQGS